MRLRLIHCVGAVLLALACGVSSGSAASGSALQFDGTNDYVEIGTALISEDITMSAWVKADSPWINDTRVVVSNSYWGAAAGRVGFHFQVEADGVPRSRFQTAADGVGVWGVRGRTNVLGAWHHLTFVKSGTQIAIVVDGVQEGVLGNMPQSVSGLSVLDQIRIGSTSSNTRFFPGLIDEVRIWDHARTEAEILADMSTELRGTEAGLVGYWKFNEGQGTTAADSSPQGNDGTISGPLWTTDAAPVSPGAPPAAAHAPTPGGGAVDVPREVVLGWEPGGYADTHDIYLGTVFEDVDLASRTDPRGVLVSQGQTTADYDPAGFLDFETIYYWRVDEVNAPPDSTIYKGQVWSFTTEPFAYLLGNVVATSNGISAATAGPGNTVDGSGLDAADLHSVEAADMWLADPPADGALYIQYEFDRIEKLHAMLVWNYNVQFEAVLGYGCKDVTVAYSEDGENWTVLGDFEFARATAAPRYAANTTVDFAGAAARAVRLTINSNWGTLFPQFGLSEVRFLSIPARAREPQPADGATQVDPDTPLGWRMGRDATSHDVYLGTNPDELSLAASVDGTAFTPEPLTFGTTYYWRIDAVSDEVWAGDLWSFSTLDFVLIDGFETYDDNIDTGTTIFDTWVDGWVNDTGSTVGYFDAPFAEQSIVRTGRQSMPLAYDNTASPFYSEATRVFDAAQNWTGNGANTLVLYFQGVPGPFMELAGGRIVMGAAGTDIWNTTDEFRFAYKSLSGDGSIVALVESLSRAVDWTKAGVMIRETLEAGSPFAAVYATPDYGCRYQARLTADVAAVSDSGVVTTAQTALRAPYWVKIERVGNAFNGYYSTDGENWTAMAWNPQTIAMGANVYIGLAITSHSAGVLASAEFSGVATTGNVNGTWVVETIGGDHPEGNGAGQLYVTLEDAAGKTATASHPAGAGAAFLAGWNEWAIPYSDLAGVNLARIEAMTIGVGNRTSPSAGGSGIVYIDDIGFGRPVTAE